MVTLWNFDIGLLIKIKTKRNGKYAIIELGTICN